jgi:glycerol-3-phosphate dehydrogenase
MLTITGGKLTTWRRMAKQTVDRMVERAGRDAPCRTDEIPLGMAASESELDAPEGVGEEAVAQLAFRYGHAAVRVLDMAGEGRMAEPIVDGRPGPDGEIVLACRAEQVSGRRRTSAPPRPHRRCSSFGRVGPASPS